jgi:uncharacterized protein YxeA
MRMTVVERYMAYMKLIKSRLVWLDQFNDNQVGFIDIENAASQIRKIIEAVSYSLWALHNKPDIFQNKGKKGKLAFSAPIIFKELLECRYLAIPLKSDHVISANGDIKIKLCSAKSEVSLGIEWYKQSYEQAKLFAHEVHPFDWYHFFHRRDGFEEAVKWAVETINMLEKTLLTHVVIWDDLTLFVDFGDRDQTEPNYTVWNRPIEKENSRDF